MDKAKAISRIKEQLAQIDELVEFDCNSSEFIKWKRDTKVALEYIFSGKPKRVREFSSIDFGSFVSSEFQRHYYRTDLNAARAVLTSMLDEIINYWPDGSKKIRAESVEDSYAISDVSTDVFIIHGHNEELKQTVARFLEKIGLKPIILHEQPNKGRTIIEKFEQYSSVGFAIALFTADDLCVSGTTADGSPKPRARQNVVFETGFFIGKLGRQRVCVLCDEGIEMHSDFAGVIYLPLDKAGYWKFDLLKELKSAGLEVDANKAVT